MARIDFQTCLDRFNEYGEVVGLQPPLARVSGLPGASPEEVVVLAGGATGYVFSIGQEVVDILLLKTPEPVRIGERVARTGDRLSIAVGDQLLGTAITPLGDRLLRAAADAAGVHSQEPVNYPLEAPAPRLDQRQTVKRPMSSGTVVTDLLLPLGRGQRELIVGDRKTGKTSFLLTTMLTQAAAGTVIVYASIGKEASVIKKITDFVAKHQLQSQVVVVASSAIDPASMTVLTPYTAMAIAEYFRDRDRDVLVILDDLTTHAKAYREISLLARRFPGRDTYPGDVFYLHARLLERAGNFNPKTEQQDKSASITCLPVAETVDNNLTGYIISNLIGITDGHLLFDADEFSRGRRPALNTNLSVTRVGKQVQSPVGRELNRQLTAFLARYATMTGVAHFGAELSGEAREQLAVGRRLLALMNQPPDQPIPIDVSTCLASIIWLRLATPEEGGIAAWRTAVAAESARPTPVRQLLDQLAAADSWVSYKNKLTEGKQVILNLWPRPATSPPNKDSSTPSRA